MNALDALKEHAPLMPVRTLPGCTSSSALAWSQNSGLLVWVRPQSSLIPPLLMTMYFLVYFHPVLFIILKKYKSSFPTLNGTTHCQNTPWALSRAPSSVI